VGEACDGSCRRVVLSHWSAVAGRFSALISRVRQTQLMQWSWGTNGIERITGNEGRVMAEDLVGRRYETCSSAAKMPGSGSFRVVDGFVEASGCSRRLIGMQSRDCGSQAYRTHAPVPSGLACYGAGVCG